MRFYTRYCARIIDRELPIERYKGRFTIATNALLVFFRVTYTRVEVLTLRHCRKSSDLIPLSEMFMSKTMFIFYIFRLPSFIVAWAPILRCHRLMFFNINYYLILRWNVAKIHLLVWLIKVVIEPCNCKISTIRLFDVNQFLAYSFVKR